uniref:Uncharacterized protein n=1 Tax=Anguilla anguilla TaxID=7936 RepID=A0A0E9VUR4_ANGAN
MSFALLIGYIVKGTKAVLLILSEFTFWNL